MKKAKLFFLALLCIGTQLVATTLTDMRNHDPLLVIDGIPGARTPKNFRHTWQDLDDLDVNTFGLDRLNAIGSGAPDQRHLEYVRAVIAQPILLVDLRQESHCHINGHAVSLYGLHNGDNVGKKQPQIEKEEKELINEIGQYSRVKLKEIVAKEDNGDFLQTISHNLNVASVELERDIVESVGIQYARIFNTDHISPRPDAIDAFVELVLQTPPDTIYYFHCRAGRGRTTFFMTLLDIIHNVDQVSLDDIVYRQSAIGGTDIYSLPDHQSYKYNEALLKIETLHAFYRYCSEHPHFDISFSEWLSETSIYLRP